MKSKSRLSGRRIVAIAAFALAATATGSASASASPTPTLSSGAHTATATSSSRIQPFYYPSQPCNGFYDGQRIAGVDGYIWECTYGGGRWYWYNTGELVL